MNRSSRTVTLSAKSVGEVANSVTPNGSALTLRALKPGILVSAAVERTVARDTRLVLFLCMPAAGPVGAAATCADVTDPSPRFRSIR